MQSNCECEQTWNMSRSREIGSQQLKPMKLYETKTIENALFLVFCCLIPVNKTMKPVTQISADGFHGDVIRLQSQKSEVED